MYIDICILCTLNLQNLAKLLKNTPDFRWVFLKNRLFAKLQLYKKLNKAKFTLLPCLFY